VVDIGADTLLCQGEAMTFTAEADSTTVNYIWELDGFPTGTPLWDSTYTLTTTSLVPGIHIVSIETNDGGTTVKCPGIDQVAVNVVYQPVPDLGNDTIICDGMSVNLDAGQGGLYLWNNGATTQTINVGTTGTYSVVVDGASTGSRCTGTDSIFVDVIPMPVIDLGPDTCSSVPIIIDAGNPGAFYTWSTGDNTQTIQPNVSGNFSVTVTYNTNSACDDTDSRVVNVIDFDLGPDETICSHQSFTLEGPEPPTGHTYQYLWSPNGQTTNHIVLNDGIPGTYHITLNVGGGCTDDITITVEDCPITIPNVITPNGDGYNDKFTIEEIDNYPGSQMIIYNRWGKKVFEHSSYNNGVAWGAENNSDGVYYYILRLTDRNETEYHGTITVLSK